MVFNFVGGVKQGEFRTRVSTLSEYMGLMLKHGNAQLSKAYKSHSKPDLKFPTEPIEDEEKVRSKANFYDRA